QIRIMLSESLKAVISQTLLKKTDESGRLAALEIMINNNAIQNLIREGKTFQIKSTMQTSANLGMQTMESSVEKLASAGLIPKDEAEPFLSKKSINTGIGNTPTPPAKIQMPFKKTS